MAWWRHARWTGPCHDASNVRQSALWRSRSCLCTRGRKALDRLSQRQVPVYIATLTPASVHRFVSGIQGQGPRARVRPREGWRSSDSWCSPGGTARGACLAPPVRQGEHFQVANRKSRALTQIDSGETCRPTLLAHAYWVCGFATSAKLVAPGRDIRHTRASEAALRGAPNRRGIRVHRLTSARHPTHRPWSARRGVAGEGSSRRRGAMPTPDASPCQPLGRPRQSRSAAHALGHPPPRRHPPFFDRASSRTSWAICPAISSFFWSRRGDPLLVNVWRCSRGRGKARPLKGWFACVSRARGLRFGT